MTPRRFVWAMLVIALIAMTPASASAQTDGRLVELLRLAQEGQSDSARARAGRMLESTATTDSLYPEILYTLGMIAGSTPDMQRHFQRIAIEYGTSPWADEALFRLAQLEYAANNPAGVTKHLDRIRADYPGSRLIGPAAYWATKAYFETGDAAAACRWVEDGLSRAGNDVELRNQLGFYEQRCRDVADGKPADRRAAAGKPVASVPAMTAAPAETTPAETTVVAATPADTAAVAPVSEAAAAEPARFRVQVAAVGTQAAADEIAASVQGLGYETVTVAEGGYIKVRAGAYATKAEAQAAARRLKARRGGAPFVVAGP